MRSISRNVRAKPARSARVKAVSKLSAAVSQRRFSRERDRGSKERSLDLAEWNASPISPLFDPFPRFFPSMWADFDFPSSLAAPAQSEGSLRIWSPRVDVYETKEALVIDAELPGMAKSDIKMKVKDGFLELSGERKIEKTDEDKNFRRIERSYGSFHRRIKLPKGSDVKSIKANFDKGMLKVSIPHPAKEDEGEHVEIHEVAGEQEQAQVQSPEKAEKAEKTEKTA
jgi:HSP20 family protein